MSASNKVPSLKLDPQTAKLVRSIFNPNKQMGNETIYLVLLKNLLVAAGMLERNDPAGAYNLNRMGFELALHAQQQNTDHLI